MRLSTTTDSCFCTPTPFNNETFVLFIVQDTRRIHLQRINFYAICLLYPTHQQNLPRFPSDESSHYMLFVSFHEFQLHSSRCFLWWNQSTWISLPLWFRRSPVSLVNSSLVDLLLWSSSSFYCQAHRSFSIMYSTLDATNVVPSAHLEVWNSGPANRHFFPFVGVVVKNL